MTRVLLLSATAALLPLIAGADQDPFAQWEPAIRAFEARDKISPPPPNAVLFVGSSTIVGWDLARHFPGVPAINRGFGGSQIADSVHFAARIVLPYRPRIIVFYAGDNDIASGKSPGQVAADFRAFLSQVRTALPETKVVYLGIKPSSARWKLVDKMRRANTMISRALQADPHAVYVDTDWVMLGADGKPRPDLLKEDGLHLNEDGYALWSRLVEPHLR